MPQTKLHRTLIVEDDPDSAEALAHLVRSIGHEVACVESCGAALVKIDEWQPNAVLLDLMLPDAQGGLVLRRVRHMRVPARVAVITAAGEESLILKHAISFEPDAVFLKPLNHEQIREWLESSEQPATNGV
jgi:CheY-like chemotaxis protein